jgi:hypothetical protein
MLETVEMDVHCSVRPRFGWDAGLGCGLSVFVDPVIYLSVYCPTSDQCERYTFALHSPSVTVLPAQLRTSRAKSCGSESSCVCQQSYQARNEVTNNHTTVDSNNEIEPWLNGKL